MTEPWLLLRILSEPLCSCSSRTRSSLCSQRRRPFSCSARSSCSCSFWKGKPKLRHDTKDPSFEQKMLMIDFYQSCMRKSTFMWSWARLSRLRVVFLMESDDRGTCFFSCSRHCLSWARLQSISDSSGFICCSPPQLWIHKTITK